MASLDEIRAKAQARLQQLEAEAGPHPTAEPAPESEGGGWRDVVDTANTAAGHVVENLMFGFGDEAAAGLGAGVDWLFGNPDDKDIGDLYDERLNRSRTKMDEFREKNPVLTTVLESAGALGSAVPTMGAAMGPAAVVRAASRTGHLPAKALPSKTAPPIGRVPFGQRVTSGATAGTGYGAVSGYGYGRDGAENRLEAMGTPAIVGGMFGAAAPVVGAVARPIAARIATNRAAKKANIPLKAFDPVQEALEKNAKTPEGKIEGRTAASLNADLAPEATALTAESLARLGRFGGPARAQLTGRADAAMENAAGHVDDAIGKTAGLKTIVRRLDAQNAAKIRDAYDTAYNTRIDYAADVGETLEGLVRTRIPAEAIRKARRMMRTEGNQSQQMLVKITGEGDDAQIVFERLPDVRELDYMSRALNDMVESRRNPNTGKLDGEGRGLQELSKEIRQNLRNAVPEWGKAVDLAKPDIVKRQLVEFGEAVLSPQKTVADVNAMIGRMEKTHPGLVEMIRPSIAQGLRNNIDNVVSRAKTPLVPELGQSGFVTRGAQRDPEAIRTLKELSGRANREKVAAIIGEDKATVLFDRLDEAAEAIATNESMGENLRTAAKEMLDAQRRRNERGVIGNTMRGKPRDALGIVFDRIRGESRIRQPDATSKAVVDYLLQKADPASMTRVLRARHRSERGLKGAKRAEQAFGGAGLGVGVPLAE